MGLPPDDRAAVVAAMKDVRIHGNAVPHHLRGEIYEVRTRSNHRQCRIIYATEGKSEQVLLAVCAAVFAVDRSRLGSSASGWSWSTYLPS